jgi:hypothetical protein
MQRFYLIMLIQVGWNFRKGQAVLADAFCEQLSGSAGVVTDFGDAVGVGQFYGSIYNMTPAHTDDIHSAMLENSDLEVVTEAGGERRKPNTIRADDQLRMKRQRTLFPIFLGPKKES